MLNCYRCRREMALLIQCQECEQSTCTECGDGVCLGCRYLGQPTTLAATIVLAPTN